MAFGTAGLRGPMRAGFDSMNDLVIVQTGQGLVNYVKACYPDEQDQQRGIVLSYDGRYNSKRSVTFYRKVLSIAAAFFLLFLDLPNSPQQFSSTKTFQSTSIVR